MITKLDLLNRSGPPFASWPMHNDGVRGAESVAGFIEGWVPKCIGVKHYLVLRCQADKFYGKYAEYLTKLRTRVP